MTRAILTLLLLSVAGCTAAERTEALGLGAVAIRDGRTACKVGQAVAAADPALVKVVPGAGTAELICEVLAD